MKYVVRYAYIPSIIPFLLSPPMAFFLAGSFHPYSKTFPPEPYFAIIEYI